MIVGSCGTNTIEAQVARPTDMIWLLFNLMWTKTLSVFHIHISISTSWRRCRNDYCHIPTYQIVKSDSEAVRLTLQLKCQYTTLVETRLHKTACAAVFSTNSIVLKCQFAQTSIWIFLFTLDSWKQWMNFWRKFRYFFKLSVSRLDIIFYKTALLYDNYSDSRSVSAKIFHGRSEWHIWLTIISLIANRRCGSLSGGTAEFLLHRLSSSWEETQSSWLCPVQIFQCVVILTTGHNTQANKRALYTSWSW